MSKTLRVLTLCVGSLPAAALAQTAKPESVAMVYGGYNHADKGYQDRYYGGIIGDAYLGDDGRLGLHADVSGVSREDDGLFLSGGASYALTDALRAKVMVGGSTENFNILPKYFAQGSVTARTSGLVLTPTYTYRKYRTGIDEHLTSLDTAKYFNLTFDRGGYWVVQARAAYAVHPGRDAPSGGFGITTLRKSGIGIGVFGEYGRLAYANLQNLSAPGIDSAFYSIRPNASYRLNRSIELVIRGEIGHNRFFDTRGVFFGIKAHLN